MNMGLPSLPFIPVMSFHFLSCPQKNDVNNLKQLPLQFISDPKKNRTEFLSFLTQSVTFSLQVFAFQYLVRDGNTWAAWRVAGRGLKKSKQGWVGGLGGGGGWGWGGGKKTKKKTPKPQPPSPCFPVVAPWLALTDCYLLYFCSRPLNKARSLLNNSS